MQAFYSLTPLAKFNSLKNQLERYTSKYRKTVAVNSKILRDAILPAIEERLDLAPDVKKMTVVDLALVDILDESGNREKTKIDKDLLDTMVSQVKFLMFAGGDVVGLTL
jgi:hypothetical protein